MKCPSFRTSFLDGFECINSAPQIGTSPCEATYALKILDIWYKSMNQSIYISAISSSLLQQKLKTLQQKSSRQNLGLFVSQMCHVCWCCSICDYRLWSRWRLGAALFSLIRTMQSHSRSALACQDLHVCFTGSAYICGAAYAHLASQQQSAMQGATNRQPGRTEKFPSLLPSQLREP